MFVMAKEIRLLFVLVVCWNQIIWSDANTTTKPPSKCDDAMKQLNNCLENIKPILAKASELGLPMSEQDIDVRCSAFKSGMACFNEYSKTCSTYTTRRLVDGQTYGARNVFKFLCEDPQFKKEYLKYVGCYKVITNDWGSCVDRFNELVGEEMSRTNISDLHQRQVELCCSQYGFVRCVHKTALAKCRKEDAAFLQHIAQTLSNDHAHSTRCRSFDTRVCSSSGRSHQAIKALVALSVMTAVVCV